MRTFTYPARIERGGRRGFVVSFPDVPEAITQGRDIVEARENAQEALGLALLAIISAGRALPRPRARGARLERINASAEMSAKIATLEAFAGACISKSELGRRLGKDEKEVRRILDPRHRTKLPALAASLAAMGKKLVIAVEDL